MRSIYVVAIMTVAVCYAQPDDVARHYCGRNIGLALELLCYSPDVVEKRSGTRDLTVYGNNLVPSFWIGTEVEESWPWLAPHKAKTINLMSRNKRFIVDECCKKACTQSELINYCD